MLYTTSIAPRQIYSKESKESLRVYCAKHQVEVLSFRPPAPGELYIPTVNGVFLTPDVKTILDMTSTAARLVIRRLEDKYNISIWE